MTISGSSEVFTLIGIKIFRSYESRSELKKALSSLPAPRNEFVIMVPEEEIEASQEETADWVEDASEVSCLSED